MPMGAPCFIGCDGKIVLNVNSAFDNLDSLICVQNSMLAEAVNQAFDE